MPFQHLFPITCEINFLEGNCELIAESFANWMSSIQQKRGVSVTTTKINGPFSEMIKHLLPLTSVEIRRHLFIQTQSRWTAFFQNGHMGNDHNAMVYLARIIPCNAIRAMVRPNTMRIEGKEVRGQYGATIFEYFAANLAQTNNNAQRSIAVANDGGRWVFTQQGTPFEFEDIDAYENKRIKDRFTQEMLESYMNQFSIEYSSNEFYNSSVAGVLVSKQGPLNPQVREYSLDEIQSSL